MSGITRSLSAAHRKKARANRAMWRVINSTSSNTMRDELIVMQQRFNGESV